MLLGQHNPVLHQRYIELTMGEFLTKWFLTCKDQKCHFLCVLSSRVGGASDGDTNQSTGLFTRVIGVQYPVLIIHPLTMYESDELLITIPNTPVESIGYSNMEGVSV